MRTITIILLATALLKPSYSEAQVITPPPFVVTNTDDSGPGSLRDAIEQSEALGGTNTITFAVTGTISLFSQLPPIQASSTYFLGPGPTNLIIQGNPDGELQMRIFRCQTEFAFLSGLTITNGLSSVGAGVYNQGTLIMSNCVVTGNIGVGSGCGAGIYNSGNLKIIDCAITGNQGLGEDFYGAGIESSGGGGGGSFASQSLSGNLTIINSTISGNHSDGPGGGLYLSGAATILHSTISSNSAGANGGGLYVTSLLLLTDSLVANNTSAQSNGFGAGIFTSGELTIVQCRILDNVGAGPTFRGGGIYQSDGGISVTESLIAGNHAGFLGAGAFFRGDAAMVSRSTFSNNMAGLDGGGLYIASGNASLTDSTFAFNVAERGHGGGLLLQSLTSGGTNVTMDRCTVSGNTAFQQGGGLSARFLLNYIFNITSSTFSGNTAQNAGGAMMMVNTVYRLASSTISSNQALIGGGIYNGFGGDIQSKNNLIAGNESLYEPDFGKDPGAFCASLGHNLIGVAPSNGGFTNGVNGDIVGTYGERIDPVLGPLANNGGPTFTHALLPGSPAINAGDNSGAPATDQRGLQRILEGTIDIGAFEGQPQPPAISCAPEILVLAPAEQCTATVFFAPVVSGNPPPTMVCVPASGSRFPLGTTLVNCLASNAAAVATCSFTVTVVDAEPPTLVNCPANVAQAESPAGAASAVVTYLPPTARNTCQTNLPVVCVPPSGAVFPLGATTVRCATAGGLIPNLARWWGGDGTTLDRISGTGGPVSSGLTYGTGIVNQAFVFDGGAFSTGVGNIPTPWTASFWVKRQVSADSSAVLTYGAGYSLKLEQFSYTYRVGFTLYDSFDETFSYSAPLDQWVNLVFVGSATGTSLYANGAFQETIATPIPLPLESIGHPTGRDPMRASVDEIAVFNRELTPVEIASIYNTRSLMEPAACSFAITVCPRKIIVVSTNDSGAGTLRAAIEEANACPGTNEIVFAFPTSGLPELLLLLPLPTITDPVIIDGRSQPTFTVRPIIELDGKHAGVANGLTIQTSNCVVRGLVINHFAQGAGILISGPSASNNWIYGNFVGTGQSGDVAVGNRQGIVLANGASHNLIGSDENGVADFAERNTISGNLEEGVVLTGGGTSHNRVAGNFIGTDFSGLRGLGNGSHGVRLDSGASDNLIGTTNLAPGNLISSNLGGGLVIQGTAQRNGLLGNRVFKNLGLGIDLGNNGVTSNDPGDGDSGPNNLQNYPVITSALSAEGWIVIDGKLASAPDSHYRLQFFSSAFGDPSGFGEGENFLGEVFLTTDATGNQRFAATFNINVLPGDFVTATATDDANNTSEFSAAALVGGPPVVRSQPVGANVFLGGTATFCAAAAGTPPFQFQWRHNGQHIPNATNACFTIPNAQLSDGGTYDVIIANAAGAAISDPAVLVVNVPRVAPGDNFANRVPISGYSGAVAGTNLFATMEPGEPNHAGKPGGKSVWYMWQAPANGIATFRTTGSSFDTLLAVYSGTVVSNLTALASDEDSGGSFSSEVRLNVVAGAFYPIAIDGLGGAMGDFALSWDFQPTAEVLPVITSQPDSQTVGAGGTYTFKVTLVKRLVAHSFQWFLDGVPIPGAIARDLTVTNVQPRDLGNYRVRITEDNQVTYSEPVSLQINQTGSQVQHVQVFDKFQDAVNTTNLLVLGNAVGGPTFFAPAALKGGPASSAPTVVSGYTGSQVARVTNVTSEIGEVPICGVIGGSSVWIKFVALESGRLFLNTSNSSYDTILAVYTRVGTNSVKQLLGCDNDSGPGTTSALDVLVQAGVTNFVEIDGVSGATGILNLSYKLVTPVLSLTRVTQGYQLNVAGKTGSLFAVQTSSNFLNWSPLVTNRAATGIFNYMDTNTAIPLRFYRVQLLP